ncbi:MAG: HAD family hydrolase [Planctomycetota bacterium]|nr:MAG: HAD family hydrolase [Planctomycetota bacterium]
MDNLHHIENFLFDIDGTLCLGHRLFEGVEELFEILEKKGKKFILLTNNSSKDKRLYQTKWKDFGIDMPLEKILTSGEATVDYMKTQPEIKNVFVLGTESFKNEIEQGGFVVTSENPDAIIMGYDTTINYEKLCTACLNLRRGIPYIASHPDVNVPSEIGPLPDCGSFIELIFTSTGRRPKIIGKPNKEMATAALNRINGKPENTVIVGDRLATDIELGFQANLSTILVLTGVTTKDDLEMISQKPDFILDNIKGIPSLL